MMLANRLSHANRYLLLDFDCGDAIIQREVAQQIRALTPEYCASTGMIAWVFSSDTHPSAGFGSYKTTYVWPPNDPTSRNRVIVGYVPLIGLRPAFQGQPAGARPLDRYSAFVMEHIVAHAVRDYIEHSAERGRRPFLVAEVHVDNVAARKFNEHVGFQTFDVPATYDDGIHLRMVLNLEEKVRRLRAEETLT